MIRWHEDYFVTRREWKKHRDDHVEDNRKVFAKTRGAMDPQIVDCHCDDQVGRFRKRRGRGCGNTQCGICHAHKFPVRKLTRHERKANLSFKEKLGDLIGFPPPAIENAEPAAKSECRT